MGRDCLCLKAKGKQNVGLSPTPPFALSSKGAIEIWVASKPTASEATGVKQGPALQVAMAKALDEIGLSPE